MLGIPSNGLHSNGFSLVRKIIQLSGISYTDQCPWREGSTLAEELLRPTRIYVKTLLPAIRSGLVKGLSHITGGGFVDNIPRVFPPGLGCFVDVSRWQLPPVFHFLMKEGNVQPREMCRTFNNGVGMVIIVGKDNVGEVKRVLEQSGESVVYEMGEVVSGEGVELRGLDKWLS